MGGDQASEGYGVLQVFYVSAFVFLCALVWFIAERMKRILSVEGALLGSGVGLAERGTPIRTARAAFHELRARFHNFLRIDNEEVLEKCGVDGAVYLAIVKRCGIVAGALTVVGLVALLPANVEGGDLSSSGPFASTTISHLKADSNIYWLHAIAAICAIGFVLHSLFHVRNLLVRGLERHRSRSPVTDCALHISGVPRTIVDGGEFEALVSSLAPDKVVACYLIMDQCDLLEARRAVESARDRLDAARERRNRRRGLCGDVCGTTSVAEREALLAKALSREEELAGIVPEPTGEAFLILTSPEDASEFQDQFRSCASTEAGTKLSVGSWIVRPAPDASDIAWENFRAAWMGTTRRRARSVTLNAGIAFVLFFFTSPMALWAGVNHMAHSDGDYGALDGLLNHVRDFSPGLASFLFAYLPSLVVILGNVAISYILFISTTMERHRTRSARDLGLMRKTFFYLFLNVVVLPALLLGSLDAIVKTARSHNESVVDLLGSMFLVNSGAFFVNVLIQSAFLTSALELVQVAALATRRMRKLRAETSREKERAAMYDPFDYGGQYAYVLVNFAVLLTFWVMCPLIAPAALLFFTIKYSVDKYNLLEVHPKEYESAQLPCAHGAHNIVLFIVLFAEVALLGFFSLKERYGLVAMLAVTVMATAVEGLRLLRWRPSLAGLGSESMPDAMAQRAVLLRQSRGYAFPDATR